MKVRKVSINTILKLTQRNLQGGWGLRWFENYSLEASIYKQLITTRKVHVAHNHMIINLMNIAYITNSYITTDFLQ